MCICYQVVCISRAHSRYQLITICSPVVVETVYTGYSDTAVHTPTASQHKTFLVVAGDWMLRIGEEKKRYQTHFKKNQYWWISALLLAMRPYHQLWSCGEKQQQTFQIVSFFFLFFVLFPLCLNVHHPPPTKPPLARSDCFKLVACSQEILVWRSSTRESTGGGWARHRLLLPETSAVSDLTR